MAELKEDLTAFMRNFYSSCLVYFPKHLLDLMTEEEEKIGWERYSNQLLVVGMDGYGHFVSELDEKIQHHILPKSFLLQDNLFKLLEKEEEYSGKRFRFLLGRYLEHLELYSMIADYYVDNAEANLGELPVDALPWFQLQKTIFDSHWEEVETHFNTVRTPDTTTTKTEMTHSSVQVLERVFETMDLASVKVHPEPKPNKPTSTRADAVERARSGAEESADIMILESVFNLDPKKTQL